MPLTQPGLEIAELVAGEAGASVEERLAGIVASFQRKKTSKKESGSPETKKGKLGQAEEVLDVWESDLFAGLSDLGTGLEFEGPMPAMPKKDTPISLNEALLAKVDAAIAAAGGLPAAWPP